MNSNDRRYIEDQIWGHPSKTGSAQPRGGRGRRNPNIYSYFLRNSNHTQRRGRSENANFDRASLMDSPKGAFIKDVRPTAGKPDKNGRRGGGGVEGLGRPKLKKLYHLIFPCFC